MFVFFLGRGQTTFFPFSTKYSCFQGSKTERKMEILAEEKRTKRFRRFKTVYTLVAKKALIEDLRSKLQIPDTLQSEIRIINVRHYYL